MKNVPRILRLLAAAAIVAPALALGQATPWNIDPAHTHASFTVRHLMISNVRGEFQKTSGTVKIDEKDLTRSTVEAAIEAGSVDTRVEQRDQHLKSPDFLDAAKFPTLTFRSTKVEKAGEGKLKVTGDLTLHGVTKPVVLDVSTSAEVKGMYGETRRAFAATTKIDRKDYGLTWNKLVEAGPAVGDEVAITLDLELVKDQPKSASN